MTTISPVCHHPASCCHTPHAAKRMTMMDKVIKVLEKVSLVAIAVFSFMTSLRLFAPAFALGFVIGLWDGKKSDEGKHSHEDHALCAHGFMEHLTGVKLPPPLALAANVAILVAHIDHHAQVFVPIVGLTVGIWAGREVAPYLKQPFARMQPA